MGTKETTRLEMFSDGVFAIAITLLILEIKVPHISSVHSNADLRHELARLWPSYFAFVLTFGFILVAWICHHALFNLIDKISPQFIYANGFLLLNIVFLPFPTATLAEYIVSESTQTAVVLYCFCFFITGISWNFLYHFALKPHPLVKEKTAIDALKTMQKNARYAIMVNAVLTVLALWLPIISLSINAVLWLFWIKESGKMLRQKKSSLPGSP
jgi:uncharacterized membrane protein